MLIQIWNWIRQNILSTMMGALVLVYVVAWASNAIFNTKFDLPQLIELAKYVLGKVGLDSVFNSPLGTNKPREGA